jgi:hypothetical protein
VIGAGVEMLGKLRRHLTGAAIGDECVDQRVAAAAAQILVAPAKPA